MRARVVVPLPPIDRRAAPLVAALATAAYIFPSSNLIVASDIGGGLFVIAYTGP